MRLKVAQCLCVALCLVRRLFSQFFFPFFFQRSFCICIVSKSINLFACKLSLHSVTPRSLEIFNLKTARILRHSGCALLKRRCLSDDVNVVKSELRKNTLHTLHRLPRIWVNDLSFYKYFCIA